MVRWRILRLSKWTFVKRPGDELEAGAAAYRIGMRQGQRGDVVESRLGRGVQYAAATGVDPTPKRPLSLGKSLSSAGEASPGSSKRKGHGGPASSDPAGSTFRSIVFEGAQCGCPEPPRRFHNLHVMKAFEAQVPPLSVLLGLFEALQLRINFGHSHSKHGGNRRCTGFETSPQPPRHRKSKNILAIALLRHHLVSRCRTAASIRSAFRPTHSEHLPGAKRHVC